MRDGKFCAHPLLARVNDGRGALRASFGLGSTTDDIDRLVQALTSYLRHGPRHRYTRRDRWFAPDGDSRPRPLTNTASGSAIAVLTSTVENE